ncbi:unnamed protein product, partial [Ectocarpus fasciculatus]
AAPGGGTGAGAGLVSRTLLVHVASSGGCSASRPRPGAGRQGARTAGEPVPPGIGHSHRRGGAVFGVASRETRALAGPQLHLPRPAT